MKNDPNSAFNRFNGNTPRISFIKRFLNSNKDSDYILLDQHVVDPTAKQISLSVFLHGGYKNPNYPDQKYPTNFKCLGMGCPLCTDAYNKLKIEKQKKLSREQMTSWKHFSTKYDMFWAYELETKEIVLLLIRTTHDTKKNIEQGKHRLRTVCDDLNDKIKELFLQKINIFDPNQPRIVSFKTKVMNLKAVQQVTISTKASDPIPEDVLQKLGTLPKLEDIYKPYDKTILEKIAKNERYTTNPNVAIKEENKEKARKIQNEVKKNKNKKEENKEETTHVKKDEIIEEKESSETLDTGNIDFNNVDTALSFSLDDFDLLKEGSNGK